MGIGEVMGLESKGEEKRSRNAQGRGNGKSVAAMLQSYMDPGVSAVVPLLAVVGWLCPSLLPVGWQTLEQAGRGWWGQVLACWWESSPASLLCTCWCSGPQGGPKHPLLLPALFTLRFPLVVPSQAGEVRSRGAGGTLRQVWLLQQLSESCSR